jgi:hypothetical protein
MKPNIFEISTKELTQDGFITWLLKWADPSNKIYDEKLNQCASEFVKFVIKKQFKANIEITKVEAGRQRENIDIWADVNEKYLIIIEDKILTGEHSNQLKRYKKIASKWCKKGNRELICIYLKIGTEAKASLKAISKKGFSVIDRTELLTCLKRYDGKNDIYNDFLIKLENIENVEKAFETKLIKDWDRNCWKGFYHYLDYILDDSNWRIVNNQAGGFLGIWWHFKEWKKYWVYLQINEKDLFFRIGEVDKNPQKVRNEWHNILMEKAVKKKKGEIKKPKRFGSGSSMNVAIVERKDWLGGDNEKINKEKVIEKLKEYELFLNYCLK